MPTGTDRSGRQLGVGRLVRGVSEEVEDGPIVPKIHDRKGWRLGHVGHHPLHEGGSRRQSLLGLVEGGTRHVEHERTPVPGVQE